MDSAHDDLPRSTQFFALVDAGQLLHLKFSVRELLPMTPIALIFEESFAKSALYLSPLLLQLDASKEVCVQELLILDRSCHSLPVLAILQSAQSLSELAFHLRSALLIEADDSAYLFRFADSQMLVAMNSVLTPAQRSRLFTGVQAWWTVNYLGGLDNAADHSRYRQAEPQPGLPIKLDTAQIHRLLGAVSGPVLASQLRNLDPSFARDLSHSRQTAFAAECAEAGNEAGIDDESELTSLAFQRWNSRSSLLQPAAENL